MPRFSIIVPHFNNANTLRRCIDSVLDQTFSDWELILIDDGSKDGGIQIRKDARIRAYRQDHKGASSARNKGIREASGDYLLFLDADDYLDENYLLAFADETSSGAPDLCLSGLTRIERNGSIRLLVFPFTGLVSKETVLLSFYEIQRVNQLYGYVAGKAVRREFLLDNQLYFDESIQKSEDLDFFLRCYEKCSAFLFIPNTDYHYIKYDNKISLFHPRIDYFSLIAVHRHLVSFCGGHLSDADKASYRKTIAAWIDSAILDTRIGRLHTLPETIQRISGDPELRSLCRVSGSTFLIAFRVLIRQLRFSLIRLYRMAITKRRVLP